MPTRRKPVASEVEQEQEPIGIVISRGSRAEAEPRFSAYVWGPAPTEEQESSAEMAA